MGKSVSKLQPGMSRERANEAGEEVDIDMHIVNLKWSDRLTVCALAVPACLPVTIAAHVIDHCI